MPTIITRGAASATSLGFGAAGGGEHWIFNLYGGTDYKLRVYSIDVNSTNVAIAGYDDSVTRTGVNSAFVCNLNNKGQIVYKKASYKTNNFAWNFGNTLNTGGVYLDGSGNTVCFGFSEDVNRHIRVTYDSSGSITSAGSVTGTTSPYTCRDTSGNFYILRKPSINNYVLSKHNSSFSLQWTATIGSGSRYSVNIKSITSDSSDNVYIVGSYSTSETGGSFGLSDDRPLIIKYNSSGTLQWRRALFSSPGSYVDYFTAVAVDSSGNVYAVGNAYGAGRLLVKYNSSGTLQWQKISATDYVQNNIAVDSSGDLYTFSDAEIYKYDSSGNSIYRRSISSNKAFAPQAMKLDGLGNMYFTGFSETGIMVFKLPTDGSKTATYTVGDATVNYTTSSNRTLSTASLTEPTISWTDDTSSGSFTNYTDATTVNFGYTPLTLEI